MTADEIEGVNTRGQKRARSESPHCEIQRNNDLWFEDGNVVFVARKSIAFRVHKSVLSRKSTVFKDMFAIPQPAEEEKIDGCAVVHVDDSPQVLKNFFELLYQGLDYYKNGEVPTAQMLFAMLNLGNKYEVGTFYDEAIYQLNRTYPSKIAAWDTMEGHSKSYVVVHDRIEDLLPFTNLAESLDLRPILSRLLYRCCVYLPDNCLKTGCKANDTMERLSSTNFARCLQAFPKLMQADMAIRMRVLARCGSQTCKTRDTCRASQIVLQAAIGEKDTYPLSVEPLFSYFDHDRFYASNPICKVCRQACIKEADLARQELLDTMSTVFGL